MKKLTSLVLAFLLVVMSGMSVFAVTIPTATIDTIGTTDYYNPGDTIKVVLSLSDISFGEFNGVSALEFDLYYDTYRLTPIVKASVDSEGDKGDFTKLLSESPDNWEGFGVLDEVKGAYKLAFSDMSAKGSVTADGEFVIEIPFKVNSDIYVGNIYFDLKNIKAYNSNMEDYCQINDFQFKVSYSPQPNTAVSLPSDAIPLNVAGYKHAINNTIFYTTGNMLVRDYVCKYMSAASGQETLSDFAIAIVTIDGVVGYCDTTIGNDKSEISIPADSYIVAINKDAVGFDAFVSDIDVNKQISLYNITLTATNVENAFELSDAGFVIGDYVLDYEFELVLKDGVAGKFSEDGKYFFFFESGLSPEQFKDLFVYNNDIAVSDKDGEIVTDGVVKTGHKIAVGNGITIILVGDVNCDGKHSAPDYFALKRVLFNTYAPDQNSALACRIRNADISTADYLLLKKLIFGTTTGDAIYNQFWKD